MNLTNRVDIIAIIGSSVSIREYHQQPNFGRGGCFFDAYLSWVHNCLNTFEHILKFKKNRENIESSTFSLLLITAANRNRTGTGV